MNDPDHMNEEQTNKGPDPAVIETGTGPGGGPPPKEGCTPESKEKAEFPS